MLSDKSNSAVHWYLPAQSRSFRSVNKTGTTSTGVKLPLCARFHFGVIFMYILKAKAAFDSAHFLSGYEGKCSNLHGHRWKIEAEIFGEQLVQEGQLRGMVVDFGDLKKDLKALADEFDHAFIYEKNSLKESTVTALNDENFRLLEVGFRPTAENFAKYFYDRLAETGYSVKTITVYETPDNCASYTKE